MPADTRVAECIRAEAGTGASIESGSQKWNPNCADLQKDAMQIKLVNKSFKFKCKPIKYTVLKEKTPLMCAALWTLKIPDVIERHAALIRAASLTLLKENALNALFKDEIFEFQKFIRRNELIPISSQPKINVGQELAQTSKIIESLKTLK